MKTMLMHGLVLTIKINLIMERNQFKAFQPVLVRNSENAHWKTAHYSNYNEQRQQHFCDNQPWEHVIPYNEETANLIGTTNQYNYESV